MLNIHHPYFVYWAAQQLDSSSWMANYTAHNPVSHNWPFNYSGGCVGSTAPSYFLFLSLAEVISCLCLFFTFWLLLCILSYLNSQFTSGTYLSSFLAESVISRNSKVMSFEMMHFELKFILKTFLHNCTVFFSFQPVVMMPYLVYTIKVLVFVIKRWENQIFIIVQECTMMYMMCLFVCLFIYICMSQAQSPVGYIRPACEIILYVLY